jgi:hypothetical protein
MWQPEALKAQVIVTTQPHVVPVDVKASVRIQPDVGGK